MLIYQKISKDYNVYFSWIKSILYVGISIVKYIYIYQNLFSIIFKRRNTKIASINQLMKNINKRMSTKIKSNEKENINQCDADDSINQQTLEVQSLPQKASQGRKHRISELVCIQVKQNKFDHTNKRRRINVSFRQQSNSNSSIISYIFENAMKKCEQKQQKENSYEIPKKSVFYKTIAKPKEKTKTDSKLVTLSSLNKSLSKSGFQYYISEVQKQLKNKKLEQNQNNIFTQHMLLSMCISKAHKYTYMPKEIQIDEKIKNIIGDKLKNSPKKLLIFDLDETLIHSVSQLQMKSVGKGEFKDQHEIKIIQKVEISSSSVSMKTREYQQKININIRPSTHQVLKRLSQNFVIGLFTASDQIYADEVLKLIDPNNNIFSIKLYRQHCSHLKSSSPQIPNFTSQRVKDLRILESVPLSQLVLIDNSPISYLYQPQNAVPIIPFTNYSDDDQLVKLQTFLNSNIKDCQDVRIVLQEKFKISDYEKYESVSELIEKLFKHRD